MSFEITSAFVQQYSANVQFLSQQKGSKLSNAVTQETGVTGTYAFFDQIGATTYNTILNRNGDTPLNNTPFSRRRVQLVGKDWGDLIDTQDKLQMLIDPTSGTAMNAAFSMGRAKDDTIISSFFSDAYTGGGLDGTSASATSFPAANKIAVNDRVYQDEGNTNTGNSSLTVAKLISGKVLFMQNNVDLENDELYIAVDGQGIGALLTATPVTSVWYNAVKPLVAGEVDSFMGYNFIRTELVKTDGLGNSLQSGGYTLLPAWVKSGVLLAVGEDIKARISERPDKRYSYQVYYQMFMGATRLEENKVLQLICDPTKTN